MIQSCPRVLAQFSLSVWLGSTDVGRERLLQSEIVTPTSKSPSLATYPVWAGGWLIPDRKTLKEDRCRTYDGILRLGTFIITKSTCYSLPYLDLKFHVTGLSPVAL